MVSIWNGVRMSLALRYTGVVLGDRHLFKGVFESCVPVNPASASYVAF